MWENVFKTVSFSSYFRLNCYLFGQVLCNDISLTVQSFFLSKNCILDIASGRFNDYKTRCTFGMLFSKSMGSACVADWYFFSFSCIPFSKNFYNNLASNLFHVCFHTMDKKAENLFRNLSFFLFYIFFHLLKFLMNVPSTFNLNFFRWGRKYRLPFSPNFAKSCIKYQQNIGIVFILPIYPYQLATRCI